MTDTDIWNWISAFIQSFAETFLLVNVYCAFLGQPRIKKYVAYSLISCFAIAYCVFINVFTLPTYLRYSLSLCVFFAYSIASEYSGSSFFDWSVGSYCGRRCAYRRGYPEKSRTERRFDIGYIFTCL